ncbi:enoyl-CoA hydratase/isomerase family protein [Rhizorhabdus argentea]|uniref:enoyl-CoA hydratase/isomerase family protein n=1 Tax=Rhizorhabdus argentea TaxID=1387174 RepID=UPI0030ECDEFB
MFVSAEDRSYLVEVDRGVLRLSLNRPEFGNAMPPSTVPRLTALFQAAQADPAIRAILIRGEGRIFSAGGDIAGFKRSLAQSAAERQADFAERLPRVRTLVEAVTAFDRPMVASIRGAAAGAGLLYPLAADLVIGDSTATFLFAHRNMALIPDGGVTLLLPQVVGERTARMLTLTAAKIEAEEAMRLGLLHRIVAADTLEEEAMQAAVRLARGPQRAIRLTKQMLVAAPRRTPGEILDAEAAGIVECVGDDDFPEAVGAFIDKRPALFPSTR